MSERLAAEIFIGGRLKRRNVPKLCAVIRDARLLLDWGDAPLDPKSEDDLLEARRDHRGTAILHLLSEDADWGQFPELEAYCVRHGLPFERRTEGKWEFDPELVVYRGTGEPEAMPTNSDGDPVVLASFVADALALVQLAAKHLRSGDAAPAGRALQRSVRCLKRLVHLPLAPLPEFQIVPSPRKEYRL